MPTIRTQILSASFMAASFAVLVGCATIPPPSGSIVIVTECFDSEAEAVDRMALGGAQIRDGIATAARAEIVELINVESAIDGELGVTCCRRLVDATKCSATEQPFDVTFEVSQQLTAEQIATVREILDRHFGVSDSE